MMPGPEGDSHEDGQRPADAAAPASVRVIRHHRRFALSDVTLDGEAVGGATIDTWENGAGDHLWSARVLMPPGDWPVTGLLAGRLRDGRVVHGSISLIGPKPTFRGRAPVMTEWHGTTTLRHDVAAGPSER